jgi:V/A-type H+-transporting ATPase subunit I
MYAEVQMAMDRESVLGQEISASSAEIDRMSEWGDFSPSDLKEIRDAGYDFHFYRMGDKDFQAAN